METIGSQGGTEHEVAVLNMPINTCYTHYFPFDITFATFMDQRRGLKLIS